VEGDTLWGLGERFNLPWEHIQSFNKLPDDIVYAGEELKLPSQRTKAFIVEPGDCAWEISVRFGLTLDELRDVNAGIPEVLYPGDVLFVPADAVLRPRQLWNLRAVKARLKGIAAHANAKFFDVFPYPQGQCSLVLVLVILIRHSLFQQRLYYLNGGCPSWQMEEVCTEECWI